MKQDRYPMTEARVKPTSAPGVLPAWDMIVVPRWKKPPLRFRGRFLSETRFESGDADEIHMNLIAREKGGVCVAFSDLRDGGFSAQAITFLTVSDAMDFVEDRCASLMAQPWPADAVRTQIGMAALLAQLVSHLRCARDFALLTGEALAHWHDRLPPDQAEDLMT